MDRSVAVTGATGFIGGALVRRLVAEGWRVRVLVRHLPTNPDLAALPIETVLGSLDDRESLRELVRGTHAVVHTAGLVKARSRKEFFDANAAGVARLAEAAAEQSPGPRVIHISSLAAREPALSSYAASKRAGEEALAQTGDSLSWTILRPPAVYGPRDPSTLIFFRWIAKGIGPLPAPETARLSLLHVDDLGQAILAVLTSGDVTAGGTYELDDGHPGGYSWRAMAEIAGQHLGEHPRMVRIPRPLLLGVAYINTLAGLVSGRAPVLSPGKVREICHPNWVCRNNRLAEQTNWRPRLSLKDGFADAIGWYREKKCL
ncbi:MAG: SDR family NAD(P)-dependent oxidoreductase [Kiloniellales bacterium]